MYFIKKFKKNFLHRLWNIICCDNPYKWFSYFCIVHAVGGQDMKQILLFDIIAFPETEIVWASTTYVEYKYKLFCQALTVLTPKFKFNKSWCFTRLFLNLIETKMMKSIKNNVILKLKSSFLKMIKRLLKKQK